MVNHDGQLLLLAGKKITGQEIKKLKKICIEMQGL